MLKKNKWKILISSLVTLSPMLFGAVMWDRLPRLIAVHWGVGGSADRWAGTLWAILFMPLMLLAVHLFCIFFTARDNRKNEQNSKVIGMVLWIVPAVSVYASALIYGTALGLELSISVFTCVLIGGMFLVIGNYLPKCRRNRTIGIKVKWALLNDENWNATHRFGGKVWVICGALILVSVFLPVEVFTVIGAILLITAVLLPTLYSFFYYKKQIRSGKASVDDYTLTAKKSDKIAGAIALALIPILLVGTLVLCFSGDIAVQVDESSFTVQADYYEDLTVPYADIEKIEFRESDDPGKRISGFGTPRLLMGWFQNDEFGNYTRYSYTESNACIVLTVQGKKLVLGVADDEATAFLYEELNTAIKKPSKGT